ncbi:hypothetical protein H671_3g11048 [Cricetulus griseus]|nr:hypothetical protein H671_3g11048 [Cricetulus griseus]
MSCDRNVPLLSRLLPCCLPAGVETGAAAETLLLLRPLPVFHRETADMGFAGKLLQSSNDQGLRLLPPYLPAVVNSYSLKLSQKKCFFLYIAYCQAFYHDNK